MHYAVIDIGSPSKGNLGWWVYGPNHDTGGTDTAAMIDCLVSVVSDGPLALGFEAPMYVPAGRELNASLRMRPGEGSRPWSGSAGATVAAISLAIVPAILSALAHAVPKMRAWQDWSRLPTRAGQVLAFEAFVSGGKSDGHAADARVAAIEAARLLSGGNVATSALGAEPCFSSLGAALVHTGLTDDVVELHTPCLVVRASKVLSQSDR